jgi:putative membrane protein
MSNDPTYSQTVRTSSLVAPPGHEDQRHFAGASEVDDASFELSSRRTGLSFQRTRMSADRTLMSVIRTSLSLITFGFTIYQFFQHLSEAVGVAAAKQGGTSFGLALIVLGVGMIIFGIIYHVQFMSALRVERNTMTERGLIHGQSRFPVSLTLIVAVILLLIGLTALASIIFRVGPFD